MEINVEKITALIEIARNLYGCIACGQELNDDEIKKFFGNENIDLKDIAFLGDYCLVDALYDEGFETPEEIQNVLIEEYSGILNSKYMVELNTILEESQKLYLDAQYKENDRISKENEKILRKAFKIAEDGYYFFTDDSTIPFGTFLIEISELEFENNDSLLRFKELPYYLNKYFRNMFTVDAINDYVADQNNFLLTLEKYCKGLIYRAKSYLSDTDRYYSVFETSNDEYHEKNRFKSFSTYSLIDAEVRVSINKSTGDFNHIYKLKNPSDLLEMEIILLRQNRSIIKKCDNCERYFIPERDTAKYCDKQSPQDPNVNCKSYCKRIQEKNKYLTDEIYKLETIIRNRIYKQCKRSVKGDLAPYNTFLNMMAENKEKLLEDNYVSWLKKTDEETLKYKKRVNLSIFGAER